MTIAASFAGFDVPVDPEADEAREWLLRELGDPAYQAAQPTWFDIVSRAVWDWFTSLTLTPAEGPPVLALLVIGAIVTALLVVAFLLFGPPRLRRRSAAGGAVFGTDDTRDAAALRAAAEAAAARGDFATAIAEAFRALARGLSERGLVSTSPGATAHGFARRAAEAFTGDAAALEAAATAFDEVRYLGRAGDIAGYRRVADLDRRLRAARPASDQTGVPA